ncbi:MAG: HEPN domain protein [candidate division TM6 bacterium GW2011_GWF2_28_16]|nr:MAG: HEPN domain protein [candidate division TM6 bacterium GW2011_GWF2_28_16]
MQMHDAWLKKAHSDLLIAKKLFDLNELDLFDGAAYHTQQCAEKAFKSYLAYKKQNIEKTHNLVLLVKLCSQYDAEFESLLNISAILNPYSIKFRYPDDVMVPEKSDLKEAIDSAEVIFKFIKKKISEFNTGQGSIFRKL